MWLRFCAWVKRGKVVQLMDYQGQTYRTIARRSAFNIWEAPVYYYTNVGHVTLMADGTTRGRSLYIERWVSEDGTNLYPETKGD